MRHTILIVGDSANLREGLQTALEGRDRVLCAGDGLEAMEIFNSQRVDLVLLDIRMDMMDGLETLRRIRATSLSIPVVVMTGHGSPEAWRSLLARA